MLIFLLSLIHLAHGADSPAVALDTSGVAVLPVGTSITVPGTVAPYVLTQKDWLLTDPVYKSAVTQAKQLEIAQPALDLCTDTTMKLATKVRETAETCLTQFSSDETEANKLVAQLRTMEIRAQTAESQLHEARQQKTVAWAITSGLVLGAVAVTAIAVSN